MSVFRFYVYRDKFLVPTVAQAEEGFFFDLDPVTICDTTDEPAVRAAVRTTLEGENLIVPTPAPADEPGSPILEKLGLRKWLAFEAEAMMYTIHCNDDVIHCYSTGRAVNGTWRRQQSKHMTFERAGGFQPLVDSMVADIQFERAAAEKPKTGGLMLLPKPATEEAPGASSS